MIPAFSSHQKKLFCGFGRVLTFVTDEFYKFYIKARRTGNTNKNKSGRGNLSKTVYGKIGHRQVKRYHKREKMNGSLNRRRARPGDFAKRGKIEISTVCEERG